VALSVCYACWLKGRKGCDLEAQEQSVEQGLLGEVYSALARDMATPTPIRMVRESDNDLTRGR
jgi:hypothetical protein